MVARSIWKGAISFGRVNIPIRFSEAVQKEDYTSFNQLCENGHKIKNRKWCPVEEREVQWSEIKKGYEITKNNYVVIEKEDIEKIKLKTTNTIEVKEFIELEEFDLYLLKIVTMLDLTLARKRRATTLLLRGPPTGTIPAKAYFLSVKILNETKKVAIGKVVLREKEHLVALRAYQRGLVMHQ